MENRYNHAANDIENPATPLVMGDRVVVENRRYPDPNDVGNPLAFLINSMKSELEELSILSSKCSIYRVSERLRQVNEKAYTPQVVSIGPLHHGKDNLKAMEKHKKRYLRDYLARTNTSLEHYVQIIKGKEEDLRRCYAEPIGFTSDEFVKIMLVDAAFIVEVLLRYYVAEFQDERDRIFNKPWMLQDIWPDLRMLENQLPFFILADIFDPAKIAFPSGCGNGADISIVKLSHKFFKDLMHFEGAHKNSDQIPSCNVEHFVDFLRNSYAPLKPNDGGKIKTITVPTVTELHRAGVKFKAGSSKNLFDICFSNGVLEIPKLTISDETELTIRNLLAFEQCHCNENYWNDYVVIMDRLVNTSKDVDLLVKHHIVENRLGDSNEGAVLINKLADGVTMDENQFYFANISDALNMYCRTSWHKWKANLRQNYCPTPWAIISVIAAVLLIVLTVIQAVCSVISVTSDKGPTPR